MSATAQSVALPRQKAQVERWIYPFALTLAGSLVFFLWQMAQYTSLLG